MSPYLVGSDVGKQSFERVRPGNYLLAVGRLNIRKNLANTLEGARGSGRLSPDFPVVVVGERDGAWSDLAPWVDEAVAQGAVIFTGFVSSEQLRWLIENCALYLCLSLDEGFGLPLVEARVLGAPVLASDISVFRETLAEHASFVDPLDSRAVGAAVRDALASSATEAGDAGSRELARRYDWARVVRVIRSELADLGASG